MKHDPLYAVKIRYHPQRFDHFSRDAQKVYMRSHIYIYLNNFLHSVRSKSLEGHVRLCEAIHQKQLDRSLRKMRELFTNAKRKVMVTTELSPRPRKLV